MVTKLRYVFIVMVLLPSMVLTAAAQTQIQMNVLAGTNAYNVFAPGQSFQFDLQPDVISGSAPGDLSYQWIDYQGNSLGATQPLLAGQSNTIVSPFVSMDIGYYGLQFLGANTSFNPQTNNRNELGFSVLPAITNRTVDPSSFFGMVQQDFNDPYLDPGYIKTRTNVHAYNATTGVVDAANWQSQVGQRYAQGQLEIPLVNAAPWPSSDNSPIGQTQLNSLQSMFEQYMAADNRVPAWELGLEEQLSPHGNYYWQNLREKFKAFNAARDTVFPGGGGPKLGYQVVNYSANWISQLYASPPTDPSGTAAGEEIDFLALHPYDWNGFRDAEQWHDAEFNAMKSQLAGLGQQDLPIWYTEGGAPINDAEVPQLFSGSTPITVRSRAEHPRFLVKLHLEALEAGVEHFTWYNYRDNFVNDTDVEAHFGLVDHWDFPKPSYVAYGNMVNSLKGKDFEGSQVLASGVTVYRFSEGTEQVLVAWSPQGTTNNVDFTTLFGGALPSQIVGTNIVGTSLNLSGQSYSIGAEPLYFSTIVPGGPGPAGFQINLELQGHGTFDANNSGTSEFIDPAPDGVPSLQDISHQWSYHTETTAGSTSALADVDGNSTGVVFKLINEVSSGLKSNAQLGGAAPFDDVARDHIHSPAGGDVEWELRGLATDGTTYDLYVIAANIWDGGWTDILVTHDGGTDLKQLTDPNFGGDVNYSGGPLGLHGHYEEFLGLLPDANGVISGIVRDYNNGTGEKYFSGLQLVSHPLADENADFDNDGDVDGADFLTWQRGFGTIYDASHFALWESEFGSLVSGNLAEAVAVPEPSALLLIVTLLGGTCLYRK